MKTNGCSDKSLAYSDEPGRAKYTPSLTQFLQCCWLLTARSILILEILNPVTQNNLAVVSYLSRSVLKVYVVTPENTLLLGKNHCTVL